MDSGLFCLWKQSSKLQAVPSSYIKEHQPLADALFSAYSTVTSAATIKPTAPQITNPMTIKNMLHTPLCFSHVYSKFNI
jgi:hypothetical protein